MTNGIGLRKKVFVCLLAFAMCISMLAGGMLIKANAASVSVTDLVTVTGDAQAESAPRKYKMNGTQDEVGDTGLYIASQANGAGYTVNVNGIFTGSVGMQIAFPGEGYWSNGIYRKAVITATSITDPAETFDLILEGSWGTEASVGFEWEGTQLYRTRGAYTGSGYTSDENKLYGREDEGLLYTGAEGANYLYHKSDSSYFFPTTGNFADTNVSATNPAQSAMYIGLEMQEDGTMNAVLLTFKGDDGSRLSSPYKKVIASFAEDWTSGYQPKTEGEGATPDLPKLSSFKDGYTISISVLDDATDKPLDLLLASIATSATGDPYATQGPDGPANGTEYTLNSATLTEAPAFYTAWKMRPSLSVGDCSCLRSAYVGAELILPEVTVIRGGQTESFTGTVTVTDSEGAQTVTDGKYTVRNIGNHTLQYVQETASLQFEFCAYRSGQAIAGIIEDAQGTVTANGAGINFVNAAGGNAYGGTLLGVFAEDAEIEFTFPDAVNGDGGGDTFEYIIRDVNGDEVFRVVYKSQGWSTSASVVYGNEVRSYSKSGNVGGDWATQAYFYRAPTGQEYFATPCLNNYKGSHNNGTFKLFWEGDVLCVGVDNRDLELVTIAKFDGSAKPSEELIGEDGYMLYTEEGAAWGLPKIADRLSGGYTIEMAYDGAHQNSVTLVSVNGILLAGMSALPLDYAYAYRVVSERSYIVGNEIYIAEGAPFGMVRRVYTEAFMGVTKGFEGSWGISHQIFESELSGFVADSGKGTHTVTVPASEATGGYWQDLSLTLHIEDAWQLSFALNGGKVSEGFSAEPITFSAHTKFLLSAPEAERLFWEFGGWYTNEALTDAWNGSFDNFNGNVTLYAKWNDVTPATVAFADGVKSYAEVLMQSGSFTISRADVVASDAAQPENVTLTVRYKKTGDSDYTTLTEDSVTIDQLAPATWEIEYTVSDGVNDPVTITRTVAVIEREAPVVSVGDVVKEGYAGFAVSVNGITATDADGASLDVAVTVVDENGKQYAVTGGTFTPDKAGVYTVSCTAADGTLIGFASYKVTIVADAEAPVLSVDFTDMSVKKGSTVTLPAASATDNAYSDITVTVKVTFGTEEVVLTDGSFKADREGVYTVTWTATDGAGNSSSVSAHVTVEPAGSSGNIGLIIGIAAAVVVVAAAAVVVAVVVKKKKAKGVSKASETSETNQEE